MTLDIFEAGYPPEISHSYQVHGFYKMHLLSNMAIFWVSIFVVFGGCRIYTFSTGYTIMFWDSPIRQIFVGEPSEAFGSADRALEISALTEIFGGNKNPRL